MARSIDHRKYNHAQYANWVDNGRTAVLLMECGDLHGLAGEHGVDALMRNRVTRDTVVKLLWRAQLAEVQPIKGAWHSCKIRRWLIRATVKVDQE